MSHVTFKSLALSFFIFFMWAQYLFAELTPPVIEARNLSEVLPVDYAFIVDFTWSEKNGLKIIEFGPSHLSGSGLRGHGDAYPQEKTIDAIYESAARDFLERTHRQAIQSGEEWEYKRSHLDGSELAIRINHWDFRYGESRNKMLPGVVFVGTGTGADRITEDKARSMLLDGYPIDAVRPETILVRFQDEGKALTKKEKRELSQKIASFPTQDLILKPSRGSLSNGIQVIAKKNLLLELSGIKDFGISKKADVNSQIIQSFYPSDLLKVGNQKYSPTGRIYYRAFDDGTNFYLYPLTIYWKLHGKYSADTQKVTSRNADISSMDKGHPVSKQVAGQILSQANPFILKAVRRMAEITQNGLGGNSPTAQEIRDRFFSLPKFAKVKQGIFDVGIIESLPQTKINCEKSFSKAGNLKRN